MYSVADADRRGHSQAETRERQELLCTFEAIAEALPGLSIPSEHSYGKPYYAEEWEKPGKIWAVRPRGAVCHDDYAGPDIGRERYVRRMPFGSWAIIIRS